MQDLICRDIVRAVKRCIESCIESQREYALAVADARDEELKNFFLQRERERASFVRALQRAVREALPKNDGIAHRAWSALVRLVTKHDERVVVERCLECESLALTTYNDVLYTTPFKGAMPRLHGMLERQRIAIHSALADLSLHMEKNETSHVHA